MIQFNSHKRVKFYPLYIETERTHQAWHIMLLQKTNHQIILELIKGRWAQQNKLYSILYYHLLKSNEKCLKSLLKKYQFQPQLLPFWLLLLRMFPLLQEIPQECTILYLLFRLLIGIFLILDFGILRIPVYVLWKEFFFPLINFI